MRVVPDEPTQEMTQAGIEILSGKAWATEGSYANAVYRAMLAAHSPAAADGVVERLLKCASCIEAIGNAKNIEGWATMLEHADVIREAAAALQSTRAEVLEEAAKICDEIANSADAKDMSDLSNLGLAGRQANQCAAAIRRGE